jgi:hypothetical protein
VAPFIVQAWLERRWRIASLYTLAYGVICLFWIEYWPLATAWSGAASVVAVAPSGVAVPGAQAVSGFGARIVDLLRAFNLAGIGLMAKNLVRFAVWQNPLLVPLVAVGAAGAIRAGGTMRSLFAGLVLGAVAMLILLPYQGHGWGYRYLHGFLGSAALMAARAWMALTDDRSSWRRPAARAGFLGAAFISVLALLPLHAWQAHAFIDPYARANAAIRRSAADVVLLDESDSWFTVDLVRNDPYLRNRPLVFRLGALDDAQVADLCARHTVALFDAHVAGRYGIRVFSPSPADATALSRLRAVSRLACGSTRLPMREIE